MACGDWYGNIRIHDLTRENLDETKVIEAHDSEVTTLDFVRNFEDERSTSAKDQYLLASGSRDNLIQIYDSKHQYEEVQIIE